MTEYVMETGSEADTKRLANRLAVLLRSGNVITLEGELGVGKTTFTKGLGEGLGVRRTINSPTFTIVKEYMADIPLYHMDAYRLENSEEDIGFDEYFNGDGVTVVEWASFIEDYLPPERLEITMKRIDTHRRTIIFKPKGIYYETVCKELYK